jgi:hypothetical protein
MRKKFLKMGTLSPCPWDLTLSGQQDAAVGTAERLTAPPCRHLSLRSGRIPALPYPQLKHFQFISNAPFPGLALTCLGLLPRSSRRIVQRAGLQHRH